MISSSFARAAAGACVLVAGLSLGGCRASTEGHVAAGGGYDIADDAYGADDDALRLAAATYTDDVAASATAKATLGLRRLEQRELEEAAILFDEAARVLSGGAPPASPAPTTAVGSVAATWREADTPRSGGTAPARQAAGEQGPFTLQAGAFASRDRAAQTAAAVSSLGLGQARVIRRQARGGTLSVVQVGRFQTRQEAVRARDRLGHPDYIVKAVAAR